MTHKQIRSIVCDSEYIRPLANLQNSYQWASLSLRYHPRYGFVLHLCGEHENGVYDFIFFIPHQFQHLADMLKGE